MSEGSSTSVEARQNLSRVVPAEIADIFGHPPVLSTENRQGYDKLMTQLVLDWKPRNITEWMFVRDITEIFRHRRAIANLFAISFKTALRAVLNGVLPDFDRYHTVQGLAQAWFEGQQSSGLPCSCAIRLASWSVSLTSAGSTSTLDKRP